MKDNLRKSHKAELLAPAGNRECFYAALKSGADAVYLAASRFGARAYAGNFSDEEIRECAEIAHIHGKKIYLTVNTLVKENEFSDLVKFAESGICHLSDGLIIQDLGVSSFFKKNYPDIAIHASTQMTVTGPEGARFLLDNGFCRVVPARELLLDEIKDIADTGIEIECFIHGAMCYSYSGRCLFSSILGGRSGNRGRCAQPCRLPYRLSGIKSESETYPLSLKDMCTLEMLPLILDAGVCSLKVEGRMKPPEYVAGVISIYRKYIDLYYSGKEYRIDKNDLNDLSEIYVRGELSHGYFDRKNGKEMVTIDSHGYESGSSELIEKIKKEYIIPDQTKYFQKIKVSFNAVFKEGKNSIISVTCDDDKGRTIVGYAEGDIVSKALKQEIRREDIIRSLKKLGNTPFITEDNLITIDIDSSIFYSLKGINELRRAALKNLSDRISEENKNNNDSYSCKTPKNEFSGDFSDGILQDNPSYSIIIASLEQAEAILSFYKANDNVPKSRIYIEEALICNEPDENIDKIINDLADFSDICIALSHIRRKGDDLTIIERFLNTGKIKGLLIRNLEDIRFFNDRKEIIRTADHSLYCFNRYASNLISGHFNMLTFPLELSYKEIRELMSENDHSFERVIYGRAPLMITAGCVRKTFNRCSHISGFENIIDRKGISFPVKADCTHCMNVIYNSVPLMLDDSNIKYGKRIEFTDESGSQVTGILSHYLSGEKNPDIKTTSGWDSRPVE